MPRIIPRPAKMKMGKGVFELAPETTIHVAGSARTTRAVAQYLAEVLRPATGYPFPIRNGATGVGPAIILRLGGGDRALGAEGYSLRVTARQILIAAPAAAGLFYGVQTLRQLLPTDIFSPSLITRTPWTVPVVAIRDHPRYAWRGLLLDVGRHFFGREFLLRFIDLMAVHKLNTLHLHLTEDQGWRLAIRKYPRLTQIGARRSSSPQPADRNRPDGRPYGPYFFTPEDIRAIVAHAQARCITIVPEIEMPGHSLAALSAYPRLSCTGGPFEPRTFWGVEPDVYCAGKETTFQFLQDVLNEVLALFPSRFVHIGGDECPKERWKACPDCQARMRAEGLRDEHELQSYFIRRMERHLHRKGRRLIGWDEILEGGLAAGATVMSWRGIEGGIAAAQAGHDVVMTPTSHCYFDHCQSDNPAQEPETFGGCLPLERVYGYDPDPAELPPAKYKHILGVQGNLWSEYLFSWRKVEYMAYPRAAALAEVAWTPQQDRRYEDFRARLDTHLARLDYLGVNYRRPAPGE